GIVGRAVLVKLRRTLPDDPLGIWRIFEGLRLGARTGADAAMSGSLLEARAAPGSSGRGATHPVEALAFAASNVFDYAQAALRTLGIARAVDARRCLCATKPEVRPGFPFRVAIAQLRPHPFDETAAPAATSVDARMPLES